MCLVFSRSVRCSVPLVKVQRSTLFDRIHAASRREARIVYSECRGCTTRKVQTDRKKDCKIDIARIGSECLRNRQQYTGTRSAQERSTIVSNG